MKHYRYFVPNRPIQFGTVPEFDKIIKQHKFIDRINIACIDRMCWGWVDYAEPLPDDIVDKYQLEFGYEIDL